jgi:hypothetical protein
MHKPARIVEDTERCKAPTHDALKWYILFSRALLHHVEVLEHCRQYLFNVAQVGAHVLHIGGDFFLYFPSHLLVSAKRVHLLPLIGRPGTSSRRFLMFFLDLDLAFIFLSIARAPTAQALTV